MTTTRLLTRAGTAAALALLALAVAPGAAAAEPAEPAEAAGPLAELEVGLTGPAEGVPGGSGTFTVAITNTGRSAATGVRLTLVLPAGLDVASVPAVDGWTCVLAPLSCELRGGLAPGASAPSLSVEVSFADDAHGRKDLAADAHQGEQSGAMRIDRAAATVVLLAPAPPSAPSQPAAQAPAPAAAAPAVTTTAPVPVRSAPAAVTPVAAPDGAGVVDVLGGTPDVVEPAPVEDVPAALPFADDGPAEEQAASSPAPEEVDLAARRTDDGVDGWLVGLFVAAFLAFGCCVVAAIAKSRRQAV